MQYYVPQFIESESKIIGPLSLKQFFIILGPTVLVILLYFLFRNLIIALIAGLFLIGGGVAFAFYKFEGQDLLSIFSYGITFLLKPRKYIWAKIGEETMNIKEVGKKVEGKKEIIIPQKRAEESRLQKIAWQIETKLSPEIEEEAEEKEEEFKE